jgi:hypothetical protein
VHPLAAGERGTLLGAVVARHPEIQGIGEGGLRSGVVHRLDVDTSGAMLLATDTALWRRLRTAFREHRVEMRYRALALGDVTADGGDRAAARGRAPSARVRARGNSRRARRRRGAPITSWRVLETLRGATLLEVRTVTGFLHRCARRSRTWAKPSRRPAPTQVSRSEAEAERKAIGVAGRRRHRRGAPHAARCVARVRGVRRAEPPIHATSRSSSQRCADAPYFLRAKVKPSEIEAITQSTRRSAATWSLKRRIASVLASVFSGSITLPFQSTLSTRISPPGRSRFRTSS